MSPWLLFRGAWRVSNQPANQQTHQPASQPTNKLICVGRSMGCLMRWYYRLVCWFVGCLLGREVGRLACCLMGADNLTDQPSDQPTNHPTTVSGRSRPFFVMAAVPLWIAFGEVGPLRGSMVIGNQNVIAKIHRFSTRTRHCFVFAGGCSELCCWAEHDELSRSSTCTSTRSSTDASASNDSSARRYWLLRGFPPAG